jgi:3-phenylpropionate/cinnamic acid dioxygenase small subunit
MNAVLETSFQTEGVTDPRRIFEDFLFMEARLMDTHKFDDWYALWTEDALYWLPCNEEDVDTSRQLSIIYESHSDLKSRIRRLAGKFAHAQSPRSRLIRVVSNIEIETADSSGIIGTSTFVLSDVRLNRQTIWFGRNHHTLVYTAQGLLMQRKKVFVNSNDTPMQSLTFLV